MEEQPVAIGEITPPDMLRAIREICDYLVETLPGRKPQIDAIGSAAQALDDSLDSREKNEKFRVGKPRAAQPIAQSAETDPLEAGRTRHAIGTTTVEC